MKKSVNVIIEMLYKGTRKLFQEVDLTKGYNFNT